MRVCFRNLKGIVFLLILSCTFVITPQVSFAKPLSDAEAKKFIEEGRNKEYYIGVPVGNAKIHRFLIDTNFTNREYGSKMVKTLNILKGMDVINYKRIDDNDTTYDTYNVSITEKGKKYDHKITDTGDLCFFKIGNMKITKIVKNSEHQLDKMANEDTRIVLGIFQYTPTNFGKEWYSRIGEKLQEKYKFKAKLTYDDFKEKYVYVASDYGFIDKDKFETNRLLGY